MKPYIFLLNLGLGLACVQAAEMPAAKFSHPRNITNPYLPLAILKQDILEGTENGKSIRIIRTALPKKHRTFLIAGQTIDSFAVEDREFENGKLAEITVDYFAQDDAGNVYYLGEAVDEYENGKVTGHSGQWMLGVDTQKPGLLVPGQPKIGQRFKSENVSKDLNEKDEVVSLSDTVTVPAGTFKNCLKIREFAEGSAELKYYAPGIGVVREAPAKGNVLLLSHQTQKASR